ncbi:hypothetical protein B9Z55_018674 [Caenorhabditis nigoni]|uniref:RING-type domain-containing protein n=1 Tax=Caenorhabditis nigoni TaxID=1611254 RepID=A0A2G5TFE8_9PELO|nr:hypothetical protein B9Z55_018674 [Caenorhabditis nigoni]
MHFPDRDIHEKYDLELRRFRMNHKAYMNALNESISLIEKKSISTVNQLPTLPQAPMFSRDFEETYSEALRNEEVARIERHSRNYTLHRRSPQVPPEELEDQECVICLAEMTNRIETVKCGKCSRRYHQHCIESWLEQNRVCPTCNEGMLGEEAFPSL